METAELDHCCQHAWQELHSAWTRHGNAAPFWDTYQHLLERLCVQQHNTGHCANELALMAQRLGAVSHAMLV